MNKRSRHSTGGLLGWERFRLFGRPAVRSASGVGSLFAEEVDDLRSTWPKQPGKQQNQMHFDFQVYDVAEMVKKMINYTIFPKLDDSADAIAMAIWHVRSSEV